MPVKTDKCRRLQNYWVLAVIGTAPWAGSAEAIRSVFLQVPSIDTGTTLLLLYGKHWGLFKQEGLDLRIVVARPNIATATLISGDAQFSAQFQSCYYSGIRGVPVKSFMVINSRAPFHFVVRPEIKSFQDLRANRSEWQAWPQPPITPRNGPLAIPGVQVATQAVVGLSRHFTWLKVSM